jgi:hypothetical protein
MLLGVKCVWLRAIFKNNGDIFKNRPKLPLNSAVKKSMNGGRPRPILTPEAP